MNLVSGNTAAITITPATLTFQRVKLEYTTGRY